MSSSGASGGLAGVVLAAGNGTRLRPLTWSRPKALCPVGGVALVDLAVERVRCVTAQVAVNVHGGRAQMLAHLERDPSIHVSLEGDRALGTAGALGALRPWIDGRSVLVHNVDAWCDPEPDLVSFVEAWDGESIRLLLAGEARFHAQAQVVATLMPWNAVRDLAPVPSGLYEASWRDAHDQGSLGTATFHGELIDCGTVQAYLRANLRAVARRRDEIGADVATTVVGAGAVVTGAAVDSVVGAHAVVLGAVTRSVVWDGCEVGAREHLVDAVRFDGGRTVLVRRSGPPR